MPISESARVKPTGSMVLEALFCCIALFGGGCQARAKPHVVLITVDALRPDHLGCYGYARETSPHIDAIARSGALFLTAISQAPWTLPSLSSLLASEYPSKLGTIHRGSRLPEVYPLASRYFKQAGYRTAAFVSAGYLNRERGWDRDFDVYVQVPVEQRAKGVNAQLFSWLQKNRTEPFFVWVHYIDPHSDYDAPMPFAERFDNTPPGSPYGRNSYLGSVMLQQKQLGPEETARVKTLYDREVAYVDFEIGRFADRLKEKGVFNNTILVLGADHGEAFMEHDRMFHTSTLYDETIRVPLIIHWPEAVPRPRRIAEQVQNIDILPTLLDLAGIAGRTKLRGRSLSPLLRGASVQERYAYAHTDLTSHQAHNVQFAQAFPEGFGKLFAVRSARAKLIFDKKSGRYEEFDLERDPGEKRNIYREDRAQSRRLRTALQEHLATFGKEVAGAPPVTLGKEDIRQLRGLGYIQ